MKILVLTRCRNEQRQLVEFLDMCGAISNGVLLLDDNSSDDSLEIAKSHPAVIKAWRSYQDTTQIMQEGCDVVSLLTIAQVYEPDWILILDVDERLEPEQFNLHKDKITNSGFNVVNFMWPYYEDVKKKMVFWGYGPGYNQNQIKVKFKRNIFLKFSDIAPHRCVHGAKPICRNQRSGWCNIVLKHLCTRPAKERLEKWSRRFPVEYEEHLGYSKKFLLEYIEQIKKLPPDHPTYDMWLDGMIKEYGTDFFPNFDFHIGDVPSWTMLLSHVPTLSKFMKDGKQLIW